MGQYQRVESKWISRGINLSRPPDLLENAQPHLRNVRAYLQGVLSNRPGLSALNSPLADLNIHSIIRLNNSLPSASQAFARYLGAGDELYSDNGAHNTFTTRASGFSGNPLQFVIMRPEESPEPWLYVSDSLKSGKARVDGTFQNHGIAPPVVPPYAQPAATAYQVINDFEATGAWAAGGTAGAITLVVRIATTIAKIVFDTGSTGWATVQPTTLDEAVQPGMLLVVNSGGGTVETVLVEFISEAVTNTTIQSIQYDAGTTGACTIQLAAPTDGLARDSMLRLNSGGGADEVVRVLSVTPGPGGLPSFRCVTVNTQVTTNTVTGLRSFRAFFLNTHVATETLASGNLESSITVGTGYITLAGALDLSVVNSRPITDEDEIHISIKLDSLDLLTEGRIAFDVDRATNDFTQNYFYKPFRTNDFSPATTGSITALSAAQRVIQRGEVDNTFGGDISEWERIDRLSGGQGISPDFVAPISGPAGNPPVIGDSSSQTTLGASQWTELRFKVGDLIRVGSDTSRSLHDVAAIRIQLQTTGTILLDADAWWIGGTFGADNLPDTGVGAPYNYRFVYRSSVTGAESNPSPPMREGIAARRQRINGTATAGTDTQANYIDIYRTGGALIVADNSPPWFYVMSILNTGSPTFVDDYPDDVVIRNRQLDFNNYQPFLDLDIPRTGVCSVVGTEVTSVSGDLFNTSWPAGSVITINNVPYTLYVQPTTTGKLSLNENAGTQTSVTWFLTSPRLMAQPLPAMWGPFGGGLFEPVMFACGSVNQPGKVFWTRSGNPDAHSQFGSLELTNPSEPLMNGVVFRSQVFVFSSESLYVLSPTVVASELRFAGAKVAGNRGLLQRNALCVGDEGIFYLSRDGIYLTAGAESISLTDEMLYPLFPHEGAVGVTTNGIVPPDFTQTARLSYGESELYFDFIDTDGNKATLLYDIKLKGWFYYRYTPGILTHYLEEGSGLHTLLLGGSNGILYLSSGTTDSGTAIECHAWTPRFDGGDPRSNKQWANGILDFNGTASVLVYADNESVLLNTLPVTQSGRGQSILDFTQAIHRNLMMQIQGNAPLTLYGYDYDWTRVSVSQLTEQRNSYATQLLFTEYGISFYCDIAHISTEDLTLTITVDGRTNSYPITNGNGTIQKSWIMLVAEKGLLWDVTVSSAAEFQLITEQSFMYIKDWKNQGAFRPMPLFGDTT